MPLFDYLCLDCGKISEILISGSGNLPNCCYCNSINLKKLLSAHSSMSGVSKNSFPDA